MSDNHDTMKRERRRYPKYLSGLAMRLGGHQYDNPKYQERADNDTLRSLYKTDGFIRSKYKGRQALHVDEASESSSSSSSGVSLGKLPMDLEQDEDAHYGRTSGIPIFGVDDAAIRTGWSVGHTKLRQNVLKRLIKIRGKRVGFNKSFRLSAENSHALGHGDYGVDHLLSAPSASQAQNTEQLAIELGMREAARKLNEEHDLGEEHSLVHAKISDVIHPETGQLLARRFKLIRRMDPDDHEGSVVFDHLMDGQRLHISRDDAHNLGQHVHDALMAGNEEYGPSYEPTTLHEDDDGELHGGIGEEPAPTRTELREHQYETLTKLQKIRGKTSVKGRFTKLDRAGLNMVGPAFTYASFPDEESGDSIRLEGQAALDEARERMAHRHKGFEKSFWRSGSVPSDADSRMHAGMQSTRAELRRMFKHTHPSDEQLQSIKPKQMNDLLVQFDRVHNSGGNISLLDDDDQRLVAELKKIRARTLRQPRGMIMGFGNLNPRRRSRKLSLKGREATESRKLQGKIFPKRQQKKKQLMMMDSSESSSSGMMLVPPIPEARRKRSLSTYLNDESSENSEHNNNEDDEDSSEESKSRKKFRPSSKKK